LQNKYYSSASIFFGIFSLLFSWSLTVNANTEKAGDLLYKLIPTVAFASTLYFEDDYAGSWQFAKSLATTEISTLLLKKAINERRPNGECCSSFPSGHTSVAFSGASFLQMRYGWKLGIPAYAAASFVAYSRVDARQHYTRDVVAGAMVGVLSSYAFTHSFNGATVTPYAVDGGIGMQISGSW
jgi:membrane-associated phospholipid phosphatase